MPMEQLHHGATEAEINGAPGISELQFEGHDLSELYFVGVSWLRDTVYGDTGERDYKLRTNIGVQS